MRDRKAIIFDFNGTLLWDTYLHNAAWDKFLRKYKIEMTDDEKDHRIHGRLNGEILRDILGELTDEEVVQLSDEKELLYQSLMVEDGLVLAEGVEDLFVRLKEQGVPMAIATASGKLNVDFYIKTLDLHRWFEPEHIIYNDGTVKGKPFPDIFNKAIEALGVKPEDVTILEDSNAGIKAAEAAGAGEIIIVNSTGNDYKAYEDKHQIITHFSELELSVW